MARYVFRRERAEPQPGRRRPEAHGDQREQEHHRKTEGLPPEQRAADDVKPMAAHCGDLPDEEATTEGESPSDKGREHGCGAHPQRRPRCIRHDSPSLRVHNA